MFVLFLYLLFFTTSVISISETLFILISFLLAFLEDQEPAFVKTKLDVVRKYFII